MMAYRSSHDCKGYFVCTFLSCTSTGNAVFKISLGRPTAKLLENLPRLDHVQFHPKPALRDHLPVPRFNRSTIQRERSPSFPTMLRRSHALMLPTSAPVLSAASWQTFPSHTPAHALTRHSRR